MTGDPDSATIRSALATPRPVPLAHGDFSFVVALQRICGLIDSCLGRPDRLALLGVDDMIYRAVAMLLLPGPAATSAATKTPPSSQSQASDSPPVASGKAAPGSERAEKRRLITAGGIRRGFERMTVARIWRPLR